MSNLPVKAIASAAATIVIVIAGIFGLQPDPEAVNTWAGIAVILVSCCWGIWKDHDFTKTAREVKQKARELLAEEGEE